MDLKVIYKNARCAVLEIEDGGTYETSRMYRLYLNGNLSGKREMLLQAFMI